MRETITHERFVQLVAEIATARLPADKRAICEAIKLTYGAGPDGVRGVTYYGQWKAGGDPIPFVAINALHQTSLVQIAGTTIHELGHVLAGWGAGHSADWKAACEELGLRCVKAAGTAYTRAMFTPDIRALIADYEGRVGDGAPVPILAGIGTAALKPCGAGIGTKGGTSRGKGSGSRLRLFTCECTPPIRARVARDEFDCTCNACNAVFTQA